MDQAMDQSLAELNHKIDVLTAQVAYLAEQAQLAERARESQTDLMETMMPVAKDAMRLASDELEDIQEYVQLPDLVRLLKKLLRHGAQFEMLLDQMDALTDLLDTIGPIPHEVMAKASELLGGLESKGYFTFARGGMRLMDTVVTSFSEEDVNRLGDNIVLILNTVKDMTQPEIMSFVRNTLQVAEREVEKPVDTGYLALMAQMRDPAVRRGLALTLRVLRVVGDQAAPAK